MADTDHITTPGKSPAFQFYPGDFLHDGNQSSMSLQECGAYIRLICACWRDGSIPDDSARAARMVGATPAQMRKLWPAIRACFKAGDEGRLIHGRLERERQKQADYKRRQGDASRKRWESRGNATALPTDKPRDIPKASSSYLQSSDLQSSDFSQKRAAREKAELTTAERAGDFIERYKALHVRLRSGAHYIGKPNFDFQEALQLAQVYDDARLDKLAFVWLNTDHKFAENGTRSLAKFRSMASWCEEQLIAWELKNGPLKVAS